MIRKIDLNCDLGEHESAAVTTALLKQVTSANIACGGHAGDLKSMQRCLRQAQKYGVRAGAHPGLPDRIGFGRSEAKITGEEFRFLLFSQISTLEKLAREQKVRLHHVKLHGALYHMVEKNSQLGKAYLDCIETWWPKLAIRSIAGGKIARLAVKRGLPISPELFADRAYLDPLTLVPRTEAGAVLTNPTEIVQRVLAYLDHGTWPTLTGPLFKPIASTLCLHGDTPGSVELIQKLKRILN